MEDIKIDGSFGEGGGSILRVAVGLATSLHKKLEITKIRYNRKRPGLRLQHLVGIQTLTKVTGGSTNPLDVGSTEVLFSPGDMWKRLTKVKIRTAGNIALFTQTLHNAFIMAPQGKYTVLVDGGGTYGKFAPGTGYVSNVTYGILRGLGYNIRINVIRHGFYPKGGAKAEIVLEPSASYTPLVLTERGILVRIAGYIVVEQSLAKPRVGERILQSITENLRSDLCDGIDPVVHIEYCSAPSVGVGVDLWAEYEGGAIISPGTYLGERGLSSEKLGKKVAAEMNRLLSSDCTVDEHASDQILPFLCLNKRPSTFKVDAISSHLQTNIDLLQQILPCRITVQKTGDTYELTCNSL